MSLLSIPPVQQSALFPPPQAVEAAGSFACSQPAEGAGSIASSFSSGMSMGGSSSGGGATFNAVA